MPPSDLPESILGGPRPGELPSVRRWSGGDLRRPGGADRKRQLRAAAAPLFAAEGTGGVTLVRVSLAAGHTAGGAANQYASCQDLLTDVIFVHLDELTEAVGTAHDAADASPGRLLETMLRGFLDQIAARPSEHRAFLFCVHALPERDRRAALLRYQILLEMIRDGLVAAVPALAARTEPSEFLLGAIRTVLSDPWCWPMPREPEQRQADSRRLAGMLLAAAEAEATGRWPALGGTAGADPSLPALTLDASTARARWSEVLKAARLGADITLTLRGRKVARVVGLG